MWSEVVELFFPQSCAGCGKPGTVLCPKCKQLWRQPPRHIRLRVDPLVPVWSLGEYAGARRETIVNLKERNVRGVAPHLGAVLDASLRLLEHQGHIARPAVVPAPTTKAAARKRGGDALTLICGYTGYEVHPVAWTAPEVADAVGLGADQRESRLWGRVQIRRTLLANIHYPVVLVDDIATTGATLAATSAALVAANVPVQGAIVLAHVP